MHICGSSVGTTEQSCSLPACTDQATPLPDPNWILPQSEVASLLPVERGHGEVIRSGTSPFCDLRRTSRARVIAARRHSAAQCQFCRRFLSDTQRRALKLSGAADSISETGRQSAPVFVQLHLFAFS